MGPEATEIDIHLRHTQMSEQQPGAEDRFGQQVKDGIDNNFAVDAKNAGADGYAPDTGYRCMSG